MEHLSPLVKSAVRSFVLDTLSRQDGHEQHNHNQGNTAPTSTNSTSGAGTDHSMHSGMGDHMMSPFLFGDKRDFFVLFNEAKVTSAGTLAAAIIVSCVFSILVTMYSMYSKMSEKKCLTSEKRVSGQQFLGAFLFAFRMFLHYIAMLLVMTMNIYVILAVVAGHAIGHVIYAIAFHKTKASASEAGCDDC